MKKIISTKLHDYNLQFYPFDIFKINNVFQSILHCAHKSVGVHFALHCNVSHRLTLSCGVTVIHSHPPYSKRKITRQRRTSKHPEQ